MELNRDIESTNRRNEGHNDSWKESVHQFPLDYFDRNTRSCKGYDKRTQVSIARNWESCWA